MNTNSIKEKKKLHANLVVNMQCARATGNILFFFFFNLALLIYLIADFDLKILINFCW